VFAHQVEQHKLALAAEAAASRMASESASTDSMN
jgi:hypothetical protein